MDRIGRAPYSHDLDMPVSCASRDRLAERGICGLRKTSIIALTVALAACRETPKRAAANEPIAAAEVRNPNLRHRAGGMDVSFIVVSDTHLGYGDIAEENARMIAKLNEVGRTCKHGTTARGLVITGDLTEYGQPKEWEQFVALYGLTGKETKLELPVFEMVGNHDKVNLGSWVEQRVSERHAKKEDAGPPERFYSWDWDDLHLIALQEGPDEDGLKWLAKDLATQEKNVPLVIFFHLALRGPWSTGNWFDEGYKERFAQALAGRNVVAIFHGHHHATDHYQWKGYDVWKPGAVKHGAHTFAVVHATDKTWTLDSYNWDLGMFAESFKKPMP